MRIGVIAKFKTKGERGVQERFCFACDAYAVTKKSGAGRAIGVGFVERRKHGENAFERFPRRVVEGEGDEFFVWLHVGNVYAIGVPKVF